MEIRTIYGTGSASANAINYIDITKAGTLYCVTWAVAFDCPIDNGNLALELSFSSVAQLATNDVLGVISQYRQFANFTTSGASMGGPPLVIPNIRVPLRNGDRIYLHSVIGGTLTHVTNVQLFIA